MIYGGVQIVAAFGQQIMLDMHIGEEQLSVLSSLGTLSKALAAFLGGFIAARLSAKRTTLLGLAVMGLSGILYLVGSGSFGGVCLSSTVQGIGGGIANTCLIAMACAWFPRNERGLAQGITSGISGASIVLATVYAQLCVDAGFPWRQSVGWLLAGADFGLCVILGLFYKDLNATYHVNNVDELLVNQGAAPAPGKTILGRLPGNWGELLKDRTFWYTVSASLISGFFTLTIGFLMPLFLLSRGYSAAEKTQIMGGGAVSSLIMATLSGLVSSAFFRTRRSETILIGYGTSGLLFFALFLFAGRIPVFGAQALFFLAFGMMYLGVGPFWTMCSEISDPTFSPRCVGICLMLSGVGGFLMTNLLGLVIERVGMLPAMVMYLASFAVVVLLTVGLMHEERKRIAG